LMFMGYGLCRWLVSLLRPISCLVRSDFVLVHHGKYFTPPDKIERLDAPQLETQPSTPRLVIQSANLNAISNNAIQASMTSLLHRKMEESVKKTVPFYCYGFV
jgi:hypothetical protein